MLWSRVACTKLVKKLLPRYYILGLFLVVIYVNDLILELQSLLFNVIFYAGDPIKYIKHIVYTIFI